MSTNQNKKGWILAGVLGFIALFACIVSAAFLNSEGYLPFRPVPNSPAVLSSAVPISWQNIERLEPLYQFTVTDTVMAMVWSSDSHLLGIAKERDLLPWFIPADFVKRSASLHLQDIANGNGRTLYSEIILPFATNSGIAFSPDSQTLVYRTDITVRFWDIVQNREARTITAKNYTAAQIQVLSIALGQDLPADYKIPDARSFVSHNGKLVAFKNVIKRGDAEAVVVVADATSRQPVRQFEGNVNYYFGVAFSPDDTLIASQNNIWEVNSGKKFTLKTGFTRLGHVAFSPDGRFLAASAWNNYILQANDPLAIQLWGIRP